MEPEITNEKMNVEIDEKPLILTKEMEENSKITESSENEKLSPAVRKIVTENKIDLKKLKVQEKMAEF